MTHSTTDKFGKSFDSSLTAEQQASIMYNDTNSTKTELDIGISDERKILYEVVLITFSVIVVYITISLLQHCWLKSKCRHRHHTFKKNGIPKRSNTSITSDSSTSHGNSTGRSKIIAARNSLILRVMCLLSALLALARMAVEQIELAPPRQARYNCRNYQIAVVTTYTLALTCMYCVLWYRVRVFVSHPAMRHLGCKKLTVAAFFVLASMLIVAVLNSTLFLATTDSHDSVGGCRVVSPEDLLSNDARFGILTVSTVLSQGMLVGIFLYPLIKHSTAMQQAAAKNTPKQEVGKSRKSRMTSTSTIISSGGIAHTWMRRGSTRRQKRELALMKIIKRVMVTACLCSMSDIISGGISRLVRDEPRIVTNLIFDANLVVNLTCIIISFKDWKVRLFPYYKPRKPQYSDNGSLKRVVTNGVRKTNEVNIPSSPAPFSSHDSLSYTQEVFPNSDSGVLAPSSPSRNRFTFDLPKSTSVSKEAEI